MLSSGAGVAGAGILHEARPPSKRFRPPARGRADGRGGICEHRSMRAPRGCHPRAGVAARNALLCAVVLAVHGCGRDSPTAPPAAVSTPRPVGIALADSLGAPIAGAALAATSLFDVNGFALVIHGTTDAAGEATLQLRAGPWVVFARATDGRVAGSLATILAPPPSPDSVLVRLVARAPSRIEGQARLAGRSDHRGILVSAIGIDGGMAVTDSSGAYAIGRMPPGTWALFFGAHGFGDHFTFVTVTAPATTVTAPDVELISAP